MTTPTRPFTVDFAYKYGQLVRVKYLGVQGQVMAVCLEHGVNRIYQVVYWAESKRNEAWLTEEELEPCKFHGLTGDPVKMVYQTEAEFKRREEPKAEREPKEV